ncbi:hypothetical protein phiCbK_124 [Caulobacter phage phiCbK]|uniref:Acyl carrier protein n=5 Tax=Viruses TaxID=10239 RepID=J3U9I1_9CAUD|nr:putative acyl carrier protein [Caulobacter phage phiCbK]AFO71638.1 hypothetical protein phiCbK_124 [Caulobacter phage phiCbK]AFU87029.1 putative acyl carrier protein [Caulobacter phage phiCbK]ARB15110.1 hypothetical protein Ccr32_gp192 [Caulobacter phage Ccr32]ARB15444.1 hypothetical protein Ccr34_gp202 [Caulobacter phage Ccr34]
MTFTRDEIKAATFDYAHAITDRSYTLDDMDEGLRLEDDLGLDSLDIIELMLCLEEDFAVPEPVQFPEDFNTLGDVITFACQSLKS